MLKSASILRHSANLFPSKIGFVGLGNMGLPMSLNLIKAGHKLVVYDINSRKVRQLAKHGAVECKTPKQVAELSELVMTSLPTPSILEEVILGNSGILQSQQDGLIIIALDTVLPSTIIRIAKIAKLKGMHVLDAPVSGGSSGAAAATLAVMVGGDKKVFEKCKPILRKLGNNIFYIGPSGSGCAVKLVNNLMSMINVATMCEAMMLGIRYGVKPQLLQKVISKGTGASFATEKKLPKMAERNFSGGFALDLAAKDLGLALELGKELHFPLFLTSVTKQLYELARAEGLGHEDHTSLVKVYEKSARVTLKF